MEPVLPPYVAGNTDIPEGPYKNILNYINFMVFFPLGKFVKEKIMQVEILYRPSYSVARVSLDRAEKIQVEAGAMLGMSPNIVRIPCTFPNL